MKSLTFSGGGEGELPPEELAYYSFRFFVPDLETPDDYFFDPLDAIKLSDSQAYVTAQYGNGSVALVYTDIVANRSVVILGIFAYPSSPPSAPLVYQFGGIVGAFTDCVSNCTTTTCVEYNMGGNSDLDSIQVAQCATALNNLGLSIPTDLAAIQSIYERIYGVSVIVDNPSGNTYRVRNIYSCGGVGGATPSGDSWTGNISSVGATIIACP